MSRSLSDITGRTVQLPDGRWRAILWWSWPGAWGGGSSVSPAYERRDEARDWMRRARILAHEGICPYGLDAEPHPRTPSPPPPEPARTPAVDVEAALAVLRAREAEHATRLTGKARQWAEFELWLDARLERLDAKDFSRWAGPYCDCDGYRGEGQPSGRPSIPMVDVLTRRQRIGWWLTGGQHDGMRIGYTRRRIASEW